MTSKSFDTKLSPSPPNEGVSVSSGRTLPRATRDGFRLGSPKAFFDILWRSIQPDSPIFDDLAGATLGVTHRCDLPNDRKLIISAALKSFPISKLQLALALTGVSDDIPQKKDKAVDLLTTQLIRRGVHHQTFQSEPVATTTVEPTDDPVGSVVSLSPTKRMRRTG